MTSFQILYPAFAMFTLSIGSVLALGFLRFRALQQRAVKMSYYKTYDQGSEPEALRQLSRHVQNHFEVPVLFHVGLLIAFVTQSSATALLVLAWGYVAARAVHTVIHVGSNNVTHRFMAYATSVFLLIGLWAVLLAGLLSR